MAAAAPPLMAGFLDTESRFLDPEASPSKSRCHLLLRWKIGTSPSLIRNAVSLEMHSAPLAPAGPWSSSRHPRSAGVAQAPPAPPWCARSAAPVSAGAALPAPHRPPPRGAPVRVGADTCR